MQVTITELRKLTNLILEHLQATGTETIEVDSDYYWNIPTEEVYEPRKTPASLNIGQLSEDIERLKKIENGDDEPIGYALTWLSSVLRYVGERNVE